MAKKEVDKSGAMLLIVMGGIIAASSLTWGTYIHWVWPIGVIVMFVGVLTLQVERSLTAVHLVVTLLLIGLMVARFTQVNQVKTVTHDMTWATSGVTTKSEGRKQGERIIALTFKAYPGHVQRVYSTALFKHLESQYKEKTVPVRFEVVYDFKAPRRYRLRAVGNKRLTPKPTAGALEFFGTSGGRQPDGSQKDSPWNYPTSP